MNAIQPTWSAGTDVSSESCSNKGSVCLDWIGEDRNHIKDLCGEFVAMEMLQIRKC